MIYWCKKYRAEKAKGYNNNKIFNGLLKAKKKMNNINSPLKASYINSSYQCNISIECKYTFIIAYQFQCINKNIRV